MLTETRSLRSAFEVKPKLVDSYAFANTWFPNRSAIIS
jgi:hypothetical protein